MPLKSKTPRPNEKYTDEQLIELLDKGLTHRQCAKELGCNSSSICRRKKTLIKRGYSPKHNYTHLVPDGYKIKGVSQYYRTHPITGEEELRGQWVKSDVDKERQLEIIKEVLKGFIDEIPKYDSIPYDNKVVDEDLMLVLPIGDLHVGMMSWKDETGNDWSIEHVRLAVYHVFKMLIDAAPNVHKILIINLGDFAHRDGKNAVTPNSGHQLDVDSRYPKMIRVCVQLLRYIIDLALAKAPIVEIKNVGGNHDQCTAIVLSECLANAYENEPRLITDRNPTPVKYCEWGKVMIATTHGDTIKMEKLDRISSSEQAEMWGRTKFRYGMTGHIHSSNKVEIEYSGMQVESFRTLAPGDSYAAWYGWRSGQDQHSILFHKEYGRRGRNEVGIIMIKDYLDNLT